jgi:hypothetical protein
MVLVRTGHPRLRVGRHTFLIQTKTVDLRITLGQPSLDMHFIFITALSCNDFPSQHQGEGHIILSHVRRYSNARFFPSDADSR